MPRPIHFAAGALHDIERLHDWLFEKNPKVALRLIAVLDESFQGLSDFSERGRLVDDGLRELVVPFGGASYVIRYGVNPDSISISRIWHSLEHR